MIVCAHCHKEMRCSKTGLGVRFGEAHVYPGDEFTCEDCGAMVIITNAKPVFDPDHLTNTIQMAVDNKNGGESM